jgi:outer membrane receptor protein involved in Fe transport
LSRTKNRTATLNQIQFGDINETNAAGYVSQKFFLGSKVDITTALRYDHFHNRYNDALLKEKVSSNASIISPKINLNYQLNNKVQLYWYGGRGFHSNDTRVVVAQNGKKTLPPAWGTDVGGIFKIGKKLMLQSALWYLWLDQEFVYVGDEGVVEAGGKTQRLGADASIRYEVLKNLYADVDLNVSLPKALGVPKDENDIPLAPRFTSVGGLVYRKLSGLNGSLRYRWMGDRPANEMNSVTAKGYFIIDAAINYTLKKWEAGIAVQNLLNTKWKETQFDTESRLQNEARPVSEIHFTPGSPLFFRLNFTFFL